MYVLTNDLKINLATLLFFFFNRRLYVILWILICLSIYRLYWLHKAVQLGILVIMLRVLLLRKSAARRAFFSLLSIVLRMCRLIVWRLRTSPIDDHDQRKTKLLTSGRYLKVRFVLQPRCSASSTIKCYLHIHRLAFSMLITVDK